MIHAKFQLIESFQAMVARSKRSDRIMSKVALAQAHGKMSRHTTNLTVGVIKSDERQDYRHQEWSKCIRGGDVVILHVDERKYWKRIGRTW
jgi:hypothetical protein